MTRFFASLLTIAAFCANLSLWAQTERALIFTPTPSTWDSVLLLAKSSGKPLFIDAHAVWCMPCKSMKKKVFSRQTVADYYNANFINLRIDTETPLGKQLVQKYEVQAFPTFLFFSSEGKLTHRASGYLEDSLFVQVGKDAINPLKQSENLAYRFEQGDRSAEFLYQYAYLAHKNNSPLATSIAGEYLKTQQDWNTEPTLRLIFDIIEDTNNGAYGYYLNNQPAFEKIFGSPAVEQKTLRAAIYELNMLIFEKEDAFSIDQDVPFVFLKYFPREKALQYSAYYQLLFHANQGEWDTFFDQAAKFERAHLWYKKRGKTRHEEYLRRSRQYFELATMVSRNSLEKKHLKTARRWLRRSAYLNPDYQNLYALSAYYYNQADKRRANKYLRKAFKKAKKVSNLDREFMAELEVYRYQLRELPKR